MSRGPHAQAVGMPPGPLPHQLTWSILNWTLPKLITHIFFVPISFIYLSHAFYSLYMSAFVSIISTLIKRKKN